MVRKAGPMPTPPLTDAQLREVVEAVRQHGSISAASITLGINHSTMSHRWRVAKNRGMISEDEVRAIRNNGRKGPLDREGTNKQPGDAEADIDTKRGRGTVSLTSLDIPDEAAVLARHGLDPDEWEISRRKENSWQGFYKTGPKKSASHKVVTMHQLTLWIERRRPVNPYSVRKAVLAELDKFSPKYPRPPARTAMKRRGEKFLLECSVPDLHIGKLCWAPETGENYDTGRALDAYAHVIGRFLEMTAHLRIERVLLPIGNDLLHVDNADNTTTGGTPQDVDSRWHRMFRRAWMGLVDGIDRLSSVAPVQVIVVPGNHDRTQSFYVGEVLGAWYRQGQRVTVDNAPTLRKYVAYGPTLLGFTHGCDERHNELPLMMAREQPEAWARATHRELHLGHYHKAKETRHTAGDTHGGVRVRTLPSLSGTDAWHYRRGYVKGPKAAEAYLWGETSGYAGHFSAGPPAGLYG
jgi:hypothetical protein